MAVLSTVHGVPVVDRRTFRLNCTPGQREDMDRMSSWKGVFGFVLYGHADGPRTMAVYGPGYTCTTAERAALCTVPGASPFKPKNALMIFKMGEY